MAENPAAYADAANKGLLLGFPVKIQGQRARTDNGIQYHSTLKYFDKSKDCPSKIDGVARHLPLNPPDAKGTTIKFEQYLDQNGYDVYVISMFGNSCEKMKEMNGKFAGMSSFGGRMGCNPHISVDKATWDKLKAQDPKTAADAGIEYGPATLWAGPRTLKVYHHQADSSEPLIPDAGDVTSKIDVHKSEIALEKGAMKNAGIALGMAGALAGSPNSASAPVQSANRAPASIQQPAAPVYDHNKMLQTISQVESSGGKNINHGIGGGPIHGNERAFGKYGLMPETIREVIKGNKDLKARHAKALALKGDIFNKYMADHKGLEDQIADRHLAHLEKHFGNDPDMLGYAWLEGIRGAHHAKDKCVDIKNHWHVAKIRDAYSRGK